jgi:hypothetical protein
MSHISPDYNYKDLDRYIEMVSRNKGLLSPQTIESFCSILKDSNDVHSTQDFKKIKYSQQWKQLQGTIYDEISQSSSLNRLKNKMIIGVDKIFKKLRGENRLDLLIKEYHQVEESNKNGTKEKRTVDFEKLDAKGIEGPKETLGSQFSKKILNSIEEWQKENFSMEGKEIFEKRNSFVRTLCDIYEDSQDEELRGDQTAQKYFEKEVEKLLDLTQEERDIWRETRGGNAYFYYADLKFLADRAKEAFNL